MNLRIGRITLKNFKLFESLTIHPNSSFNIIIGENSAGKSTIFEALHLWEKCYQTYILASRKGFYKVSSTNSRYVNYRDLDFLRITQDDDLFFDPSNNCAEIVLILVADGVEFELGFKITSPISINNAFFRVQPINQDQFTAFSTAFTGSGKYLDEAIFIYQTRPISGVHQYEPYYNDAQVKKKIQRGFSHEVLRNKIVARRDSITQLEESISEILEKKVEFSLPAKIKEKKDEYVSLKVKVEGASNHDLHLQGSGFLQIVEILSTIEFIDAPLKLLLVDEPDSHIHSKLQQSLITHLRKIDNNQFFVISHNDQFVTNAGDNEIFFLSNEAKEHGELKPIPTNGFDVIKKSLGGVILALDLLSRANSIIFIEGNDDESYIRRLAKKYAQILVKQNKCSDFKFFPLRGKDNIQSKIEYNKRTLSALFSNKRWITIFDRDFSTDGIDLTLKASIKRKMGNGSIAYSHNGYCIESVLFSDINILKLFILRVNPTLDQTNLNTAIDDTICQITANISNVTSEAYATMRVCFLGQKNNRTEFNDLSFDQIVQDWNSTGSLKLQNIMNKSQINAFVVGVEQKMECSIVNRSGSSDEDVASALMNKYIDSIEDSTHIYSSFQDLLVNLGIVV